MASDPTLQNLSTGIQYDSNQFVFTSSNALAGARQLQAQAFNFGSDYVVTTQAAGAGSNGPGGSFGIVLGAADNPLSAVTVFAVAREQTPGGSANIGFNVQMSADGTAPTVITNPSGGGISIPGFTGSTTPGGMAGSVQYNIADTSFGGDTHFLYNSTSQTLTIPNLTVGTSVSLPAASVTLSEIQQATASSVLLGAGSSGSGSSYSQITLGTGLTMTGTVLSASGGGAAWLLTGNAGTNPAVNYVGTSDAQNFAFGSNGVSRLLLQASGQFSLVPTTDNTSGIGTALLRFPMSSAIVHNVFATAGDANPSAQLSTGALNLGPGGVSALDLQITRNGAHILNFNNGAGVGANPIGTLAPSATVVPLGYDTSTGNVGPTSALGPGPGTAGEVPSSNGAGSFVYDSNFTFSTSTHILTLGTGAKVQTFYDTNGIAWLNSSTTASASNYIVIANGNPTPQITVSGTNTGLDLVPSGSGSLTLDVNAASSSIFMGINFSPSITIGTASGTGSILLQAPMTLSGAVTQSSGAWSFNGATGSLTAAGALNISGSATSTWQLTGASNALTIQTAAGLSLYSSDSTGIIGSAALRWQSVNANIINVYGTQSDAQPVTQVKSTGFLLGAGGSSTPDILIERIGASALAMTNNSSGAIASVAAAGATPVYYNATTGAIGPGSSIPVTAVQYAPVVVSTGSSNTAVLNQAIIITTSTSGTFTETLPAASGSGKTIVIKNVNSSATVINIGNGTDTIDGVSGTSAYQIPGATTDSVTLFDYASTKWSVI